MQCGTVMIIQVTCLTASSENYVCRFREQIIISDEVYELLIKNDYFQPFRDLGERRLKDLIKPLKLFQNNFEKALQEEISTA